MVYYINKAGQTSGDSHKIKHLVDELPFLTVSLDVRHPLERELFEDPFTSASTFSKMVLFDSITTAAVEVAALLLHHLPDCQLQFFLTTERGLTMGTNSWLVVNQVTGRTG